MWLCTLLLQNDLWLVLSLSLSPKILRWLVLISWFVIIALQHSWPSEIPLAGYFSPAAGNVKGTFGCQCCKSVKKKYKAWIICIHDHIVLVGVVLEVVVGLCVFVGWDAIYMKRGAMSNLFSEGHFQGRSTCSTPCPRPGCIRPCSSNELRLQCFSSSVTIFYCLR